jgi:uncharacterized protein (TIGR02246 family)
MPYVLGFLLAALSVPAVAADLKQEVDELSSAYVASFNKQDGDGIAALFASDGIFVNPTGTFVKSAGQQPDIAGYFRGAFKAGVDHEEVTVKQLWPLGTDTALGVGEYRITGKSQTGAPIEVSGRWTAVYVRDDGKLKLRMLSGIPNAPPPPK